MRIIGCGNRDRADDAVGLLVADRLRELGADAEAYSGDPFGLMHRWTADDEVLLVDAVVTGACPGAVYLWDGLNHRCLSFASPVSNHGFDITQAIQLARTLGRLPAKLRICAIEAQDCAVGGEITDRVRRAGAAVVEAVLQECCPPGPRALGVDGQCAGFRSSHGIFPASTALTNRSNRHTRRRHTRR